MNTPATPAGMPSSSTNRFQLVITPEFMAKVDDWRRKQEKIPNQSEAIRALVELGIEKASEPPKRKGRWLT